MELIISNDIAVRIDRALAKAKRQEIGGLLVGEHVGAETFRIVDISIQTTHGSYAHFERDPELHAHFLETFFKRTGENYKRYNYLGEWHSHPSFELLPSSDDVRTMRSIVDDPQVGVNFAVLLIVRRDGHRRLALSAMAFPRSLPPQLVTVRGDTIDQVTKRSLVATIRHYIRSWVS
ncbi:MAG: hypothetical protein E5W94_30735 [Mesorhizobium sp.]|nr:MAG: hypothetical protein E5W94_30735 [Mesorhizobium sp.]